jgi:predicted nucleotidyltransferase
MNKQDILAFLGAHKTELQNRFGVLRIGLFGSYARDEQSPGSDVDILVEIQSDNTFRSFFGLKAYLEDSLRTTVDLGMESAIKPAAKASIQRDIIYA